MSDPNDLFAEMEAEARASRPHDSGGFTKASARTRATAEVFEQMSLELPPVLADPDLYPFNGTLTETQRKALGASDMKPGFADWIDAGGGKSGICIAEASRAYVEGKIDGMIIAAPMGPHAQWVDEQFPKWCAVPWRGIDVQWPKTRIERVFERANDDVMGVLTINHDALRTRTGEKLIDRFLQVFPRVYFAVDESSRFKSPKALRTLGMIEVARRAVMRRMLSGTPILKGIEDLFTQYDAAEPGITGFREYLAYRRYYCRLEPVRRDTVRGKGLGKVIGHRIVGYRNERELARRTAPYAIRIPSSEFHDSTPLFMQVRAPMGDKQARAYGEMKTHLVTEIEAGRITANNALVQMNKLLQIASGYIFDAEGEAHWLGTNKVQAVHDLLDELDEPVVLFAPFVPLLDMLELAARERGDRPVFRYKNRQTVLDWNAAGGLILGNQGSGLGIGQNLQLSAATIYAANGFGAEPRWQSVKRTDRMGQTRQPRYWDLVAPYTLDIRALEVLDAKEDVSQRNLEQLRRMLE